MTASFPGGELPLDSAEDGRFNPDMLRLARLCRHGLTQAELADRLAVRQSKVSKWEDALLVPSPVDVERVARALDFPMEFFFTAGQVYGFGSSCLYHRKRQSLSVKLLSTIHARINVIGLGLERLLQKVEMEADLPFPRLDVDDYGSPEDVAGMLRGTWRIPMGPIKDLMHYIESTGAIIVPMSFGTDKLDAVSLWPARMPPLLFSNIDTSGDRQRHTLAHEVGHLVMHSVPSPDAEEEADRFAAELLMPAREVVEHLQGMTLHKAQQLKVEMAVVDGSDTEAGQGHRSNFTTAGKVALHRAQP